MEKPRGTTRSRAATQVMRNECSEPRTGGPSTAGSRPCCTSRTSFAGYSLTISTGQCAP